MIKRLMAAVEELWVEYNRHPFIKGLENGNLDRDKFKYYIIQDYLYLLEYAKVFGIGIAKAKSLDTMRLFASYVHQLTDGEMDLHLGYLGKFGITEQEVAETPRSLDNLSYTSYMLRVAYEEGEAEVVAAILACAYSYEIIARNILKNNPAAIDHPFYGEWIAGYASEEYHQENVILIDLLERLTEQATEAQKQHIIEIFVACSRYEMAFWDLAWNQSK